MNTRGIKCIYEKVGSDNECVRELSVYLRKLDHSKCK